MAWEMTFHIINGELDTVVLKTLIDTADLSEVDKTRLENLIELTEQAEELGATTAKSATQVLQLQESLARLGFTQSGIIDLTPATILDSFLFSFCNSLISSFFILIFS